MTHVQQELMLPEETARWFRRSPSWLRQQSDLLRLGAASGQQPLYHVHLCRAYILGKICGFTGDALRDIQLHALANTCGLPPTACGPATPNSSNPIPPN